MNVAIIDADLIGRKNHRFPNLASMKISGYHKDKGDEVILKTNYDNLDEFDVVYISKAFTDTPVPNGVLDLHNVKYGGTGFFYDKAPPLDDCIEHHMPDYDLYNEFVELRRSKGEKEVSLKFYTSYSIGYSTRGCFRKCGFCVNQHYNKVNKASSISEFLDPRRKRICLLDDNILGYSHWRDVFDELKATNKAFKFNQGMDIRLLNDEKCEVLFSSRYDGDFVFAFDNIEDKSIVEEKLKLARKYTNKRIMLYVLVGFDRSGKYDDDFWVKDLYDMFERIRILMKYDCTPYIMRHEKYNDSPYRGVYIVTASWANQPSLLRKNSLLEYCEIYQKFRKNKSAKVKYIEEATEKLPDLASRYFNMKMEDVSQ